MIYFTVIQLWENLSLDFTASCQKIQPKAVTTMGFWTAEFHCIHEYSMWHLLTTPRALNGRTTSNTITPHGMHFNFISFLAENL